VTALWVINKDDKGDKEYGQIIVRNFKPPLAPGQPPQYEDTTFDLKHNQLIILKARLVEYRIEAKNQKVFVVGMRMGGGRSKTF
jgi:hypothetical protein